MSEDRICATCGRRVRSDDRYCAGCGVAFAGAPARVDSARPLPGFSYHFIQGLAWGLGLTVAGAIASVIALALVALTLHGTR